MKRLSKTRQDRQVLNEGLKGLPNVLACGFGVKVKEGKNTLEPCVTVFVSRKVVLDQIPETGRIPSHIRVRKQALVTDVVPMGAFQRQAAPVNYPFGECLSDGVRNGTRSAYASTEQGIVAFTCSHVVAGADADPATPALVNSFDWASMAWKPFGYSDRAIYEPGSRVPMDFGYIDASLVTILPEILSSVSLPSTKRRVFQPSNAAEIEALPGARVRGFGIASGACEGFIQAVLVEGLDKGAFAADLLIGTEDADGLTREGDSGMLWTLDGGSLLGQHALGQHAPPGYGSTLTIATFLYRITEQLGIESVW